MSAHGAPPRAATAAPSSSATSSSADLILRNTLRYTISAPEYALLHKYILSRSRMLRKRVPSVEAVQQLVDGPARKRTERAPSSESGSKQHGAGKKAQGGAKAAAPKTSASDMVTGPASYDYTARAVRHSLRVFVITGTLMRLWALLSARLAQRQRQQAGRAGTAAAEKRGPAPPSSSTSASSSSAASPSSPALRLSLSLATILLLHRLLFRFFSRLRLHLLDPSAAPFRQRNPRTAQALTSAYAPALGASLAGLALGIYPGRALRAYVAVYALFRALEFGWNAAEDSGVLWGWEKSVVKGELPRPRPRPWWWGSWMLQPLAFGQLLHAAVFDRDCFPAAPGNFIFSRSTAYLQPRPDGYPASLPWPGPYDILDSMAQMARLNWPPFISPTLFPDKQDTLPAALAAVAPITSGAHPLITSLACATLHPSDPSCSRTFLTFWLRSFGPLARLFLIIYSAALIPRLRLLYNFPVSTLRTLIARALRTTTFLTGAMSTAWASVCLFQAWLPRGALPTQRFFLGGFLAGLWAWADRRHGRAVFLYSARLGVDSLWKSGVKRRWWRAMRGGDVWLFVLALMLSGAVYERDKRAVRETALRKGISWARGEGWRDWAVEEEEGEEEEEEEEQDVGDEGGADVDADSAREHEKES